MTDMERSKEWLDFAAMDLGAAEHLLTMYPVPLEIICYHCEQAAEKTLKGILVAFHMEPPKTHDLVQLCKLCSERDDRFADLQMLVLNWFHMASRCGIRLIWNWMKGMLPAPFGNAGRFMHSHSKYFMR